MTKRPTIPDDDTPAGYEEIRKTLGTRLKEARQKAGLTQSQLGALVGMTQSYVFEIEAGGANITLKTVARLAAVFSMDARDFLPESRASPLSVGALERLHALFERTAAMFAERQSEEGTILKEFRELTELRFAIERSLGHVPSSTTKAPPGGRGGPTEAKKTSH